jgi:hypothetical protein
MVLSLVTSRNYGKPKLPRDNNVIDEILEKNRRMLDQRLFDLVPLFPRNTEVIASVVRNPTVDKPHVSVVSLVEDSTDSEEPIFIGCASLANPDTHRIKPGPELHSKDRTEIRLASEGTSRWDEIRMSTLDAIVRMK